MASIFRDITYKELAVIKIDGTILDIGGQKNADYHKLIPGHHTFFSVNLEGDADKLIDIEKNPLPYKDAEFDAVLIINVLEHLYDYNFALQEASRVLKAGGQMICIVPFFINLHPSPNDYFRFTKQALEKMFSKFNFKNVSIDELGKGFFLVRYYLLQRFLPSFLDYLFRPLAKLAEYMLKFFSNLLGRQYNSKEYPLGYLIKVIK